MKTPWPLVRVDSVGEVQAGRQRSAKIVNGTSCPYLRVANVFDGYIDFGDVLEMPFTESEQAIYSLKPNDILLNEGQSLELVGRSSIYTGPESAYCFQNTLVRFRPSERISPQFAQGLFQFYRVSGVFASIAKRTTSIAHLGVQRFAGLEIPLPPLEEQAGIVRVLKTWDDGIRQISNLIAAKVKFKQGLMQQVLTGKRRFPEFGDEWEEAEIRSFLTESRVPGSHGKTARKLTVKLYGKGVIPKKEVRAGSKATKYYVRSKGQFIYSKLDCLNGAFGIIPDELDGYETTLDLPAFDVADVVNTRWFWYFMIRESFYKGLLGLANGGRKARRVNPRDLLRVEISMPTRAEQDRITELLEAADQEITLLQEELDALKEQKKGLMQKLLTGEIRVRSIEAGGRS